MILQSLAGLPTFLAYFSTAFAIGIVYLLVYTRITPDNGFALIRNNVPGAAIALGMSLLGSTIPIPSVVRHNESPSDRAPAKAIEKYSRTVGQPAKDRGEAVQDQAQSARAT